MIRYSILLGLIAVALSGCGGGARVDGRSMLREIDRYTDETASRQPLPPASDALELALAKRDQARPAVDDGKDDEVLPILDEGVADARFSLAAARAAQAENKAHECLRVVERARQDWEEILLMLEQTERVAARTMDDVPREPPAGDAPEATPLPVSTLDGRKPAVGDAMTLGAKFTEWKQAAAERHVDSVELESLFDRRIAAAEHEKTKDIDRPRHLYTAGRAVQELEARVREEEARNTCVRAVSMASKYGDAREQALRATLELERSLKAGLRDELEKTRQEALDRQADLFDAMRSLEGKFATITQNARGTIVSLADILFDFNKATLKRDVEFSLVKIATILGQFPEMKILVEGHTDNVGTEEYNQELSLKRAQSVRDFLASQGVQPERMSVEGLGLTRPVADNSTEAGRQKNRRVDLVIAESK